MKKQTFGSTLAGLRKEKGMTQLDLAEKMGVTDKAVSKWERDLSFPDVNTLPKLAEIFNITVADLMQTKKAPGENVESKKLSEMTGLVLKGIALAMGIAAVVLSFTNQIGANEGMRILGIGLACLAIAQFP